MNELIVRSFLDELNGIEKTAAMPKYLRGITVPLMRRGQQAERAFRELSTKAYVKATTEIPYAGKALETAEDLMNVGPSFPAGRHVNTGLNLKTLKRR